VTCYMKKIKSIMKCNKCIRVLLFYNGQGYCKLFCIKLMRNEGLFRFIYVVNVLHIYVQITKYIEPFSNNIAFNYLIWFLALLLSSMQFVVFFLNSYLRANFKSLLLHEK